MGDTYCVAHRVSGFSPTDLFPTTMRTATIAILGAPFAGWALYGCLAILGFAGTPSVVVAILWGVIWLAIAHLGRNSRLFRRRRPVNGRGTPGGRGVWTGAVLGSFFLPIPVCLLTLLIDQFHIAPASVVLPLFAMLALPVPTALWWMMLWPAHDRDEEVMRPLGWRRYTPHAPSGVIPPRGGPGIDR
jgi:hypothetical protein